MMKAKFPGALAVGLLLDAVSAVPLTAAAVGLPMGGLVAARSGNDLVLTFPATSPDFYTVQTCSSLLQPWTNFQPGIEGDGTVKVVTVTNAIAVGNGFYRLLIQRPANLVVPQSAAFAILGHWCGGIREQIYVTGFDPTSGYPTGEVSLSTTCSTGGRGSRPATFTASAAMTWDFAGNVVSSGMLSNAPTVNPTPTVTDAYGDTIYSVGPAAYLVVPVAAAPSGLTASQSGDQFQVSWTPKGVNPAAVTSSTLTATPANLTASTLTTTVAGSATSGIISSLQPQTTYQITVVNTTISGSGPASIPITVTTRAASAPPSPPAGVTAAWTNLDPTGSIDTLVVTWQAAVPGDSPIDEYRITITGSDGAGMFTQMVSGTTLTASFTVDYIPNWSVTVQAHNAIGSGPTSNAFALGGL